MNYLRLSDCAIYRNERTRKIDYETYITTENMLPNRGGVIQTEVLPDSKTVSKYLPNDILLSNILKTLIIDDFLLLKKMLKPNNLTEIIKFMLLIYQKKLSKYHKKMRKELELTILFNLSKKTS